ncbi:hypothetical protein BSI_17790 [Bacillus inaquosorum KCTC 13429]|uniref:Uncharacterized protein n=1 Tax=Bacillus inaquosorum KCTC 13429 TaxID=1236548 RepID=A0A9W5LII7_9BACI|nr:hypothetical protein BSI_17790 [Bacillus inaquosorum KCTC 13429]
MIITMILSNHIKNITKSLKHLFIPPVTYRGFFIYKNMSLDKSILLLKSESSLFPIYVKMS